MVESDLLVPITRLVTLTTVIRSSNALAGDLLSTSTVSTGTCSPQVIKCQSLIITQLVVIISESWKKKER